MWADSHPSCKKTKVRCSDPDPEDTPVPRRPSGAPGIWVMWCDAQVEHPAYASAHNLMPASKAESGNRSGLFRPQLYAEGRMTIQLGIELDHISQFVFGDVDIHWLFQRLGEIRNSQLPVRTCIGFEVEPFHAQRTVLNARGHLCGKDWFGVGSGDRNQDRAGSKIRRYHA